MHIQVVSTGTLMVLIRLYKKIDLMATKDRKVYVDENKLSPGKNGHHKLSGLGSRLIVLIRQRVSE